MAGSGNRITRGETSFSTMDAGIGILRVGFGSLAMIGRPRGSAGAERTLTAAGRPCRPVPFSKPALGCGSAAD